MANEESFPGFERDFDAIEAAVMETARGRWFLGEFARRNRVADTGVLLEAIGRLGEVVSERPVGGPDERLRADLGAMEEAIDGAKSRIAALGAPGAPPSGSAPTSEMFARVARATEIATGDILDATERMQEAAWNLREAGIDPAICEELDRRAAQIYTACGCQEMTAKQTRILLDSLHTIEDRLAVMRGRLFGGRPEEPDVASAAATAEPRDDIAFLPVATATPGVEQAVRPAIGEAGSAAGTADEDPPARRADAVPRAPRSPTPPEVAPASARPIPASFAAIEALGFRERMKLFT